MKTQNGSILIIEESAALRSAYAEYLEDRGFRTFTARGAADGKAILASLKPDVTTLDLGVGDGDGFELIEDIVKIDSRCMVVSMNDQVEDRIHALELGADDYLIKPVDLEEFYLRVRNILTHRRAQTVSFDNPVIELNGVKVDVVSRALVKPDGGHGPELTETEFTLLRTLAESRERVVSKETLCQSVYGRPYTSSTRALDVGISRLRIKLKAAEVGVDIKSVRQVGYFLNYEDRAA